MALEMGASTLVVLGGTYVVPRLWNPIKSMIGQGVKMIKSMIDQDVRGVKADLQYVKGKNTILKTCKDIHIFLTTHLSKIN